jgi:uncharacterized integral membrane protein
MLSLLITTLLGMLHGAANAPLLIMLLMSVLSGTFKAMLVRLDPVAPLEHQPGKEAAQ